MGAPRAPFASYPNTTTVLPNPFFSARSQCAGAGVAQMRAFAALVDQSPDVARSVRNLFLSEADTATRDEKKSGSPRVSITNEEFDTLEWLILLIARALAPTLEILSYVTLPCSEGRIRVNRLHGAHWQCLRGLMIHEPHLDIYFRSYPSLRRLHMHTNSLFQDKLPRLFGDGCPQLTHWKISRLFVDGVGLVDDIEKAWPYDDAIKRGERGGETLTLPNGSHVEIPPVLRLPSSLHHIILQPAVLPETWPSVTIIRRNRALRDRLKIFAETGRARGVEVQEIEAEDMNDSDVQKVCAQAKREWLEILNGGVGCWTEEDGGAAAEGKIETSISAGQLDPSPMADAGHPGGSAI
ncbi:hypothetical protein BOTBODRAFT_41772 [Botryobasidium botryosum FD-172 SS1]|uniref:Uncharacterized protein n=1 Tax=Botryobasidium botryosum (strain FD-172 SS1) TaxID=930990 RepID=A0A067MVJ6_BOTB1|nr:hypothetical protein BOTBODRAFT_41772 [Botryobasidium botryosum FD-172 SS1]